MGSVCGSTAGEHKEIAFSDKVLDGYVGRYRLHPDFVIKIFRNGDPLCAQGNDQSAFELFAETQHPVGSVTAGIVLGRDLIWTKGYGDADMEKHVPADKDTICRIGSITKMFTAVMPEQMVAAGKVHWTDRVDKYFFRD